MTAAATPLSTDGAALAVIAPTSSSVMPPAMTANSLCRGQGTPAIRTTEVFEVGAIIGLRLSLTSSFEQPKQRMGLAPHRHGVIGSGIECRYATFR